MINILKSFDKKEIVAFLILIFICITSNNLFSNTVNTIDYENIKTLPILHEGRIKPLDSYARIVLKSIANKETIDKKPAINWFVDLLLNPSKDYNNAVFYIHNPDLKYTLELEDKKKSYYSFKEILPGIKKNISLISSLETKSNEKETIFAPAEKQLLDLYHHTLLYFDLSRSFSFLIPEFDKTDVRDITHHFEDNNLDYQNKVTYWEIIEYKNAIASKVDAILKNNKDINNINPSNAAVLRLAKKFKEISQDKINISLKIIPYTNIFEKNNNESNSNKNWLAPWEIAGKTIEKQQYHEYLNIWQNIFYSYYKNDFITFNQNTLSLKKFTINNIAAHQKTYIDTILKAEVIYNNYSLFNKSIILYVISLLISIFYLQKNNNLIYKNIYKLNLVIFTLASICHLLGILLRIFILQRPPVANLYESILFVGLLIAIISLIIECVRRDGIGLFTGSLICCALQFIANSYASAGDTLGVLIAVLDNNFWLGTHVIAITSGYGCCLVLSALSHAYLFKSCLIQKNKSLQNLHDNYLGSLKKYILLMCLLSLFLTLLGTILGGIWADQSWGRFWGWDPKENGALLICLWLTALLHGRISGQLSDLIFITGAALTSIMVMLAWFGVNVLATGLHSYGFTENIAHNLLLFVALEIMLVLGLLTICKTRKC